LHTLADTLANAMTWIMGRLKSNTTGLLEFQRRNPEGIENQVWKDSWDSYFHADGTIANHSNGIASIEVQGLAYDALSNAAALYENYLHQKSEALRLRHQAEQLQATIFSTFWVREKGGYFSLGTDRDDTGSIRQLAVRASNMGHLLRSRLLQGDETSMKPYREALVRQLFSPELLCRNGVRTVASDEVRFRAGAYHDGSCWGWDTYAIAQGLDAQGYHLLADHLKQAVVRSIKVAQRYIEFTRGSNDPHYSINAYIIDVKDTVHNRMNRLEQPPQDMQAWTVAAMYEIELQQRENKGLPITQPRDLLEEEIVRTIS
jgi:glycogen debranching enzyme